MPAFTETLTQGMAILGYVGPSNHTNNTDTQVAGIDMSNIRRLITYVSVGVYGSSANIQVYYQASATANMASPTNVASSIPLTANTANRLESLEVRADQLPAGTRYVQPVVIVNTAASNIAILCLGDTSAYKPANQLNVANLLDQGLVT